MCKVKTATLSGFKRKIIPKLALPTAKTQKIEETSCPVSNVEEKKLEEPEEVIHENEIEIKIQKYRNNNFFSHKYPKHNK